MPKSKAKPAKKAKATPKPKMDINVKFQKLARAATQIIDTDNILMDAIRAGDTAGQQVAIVNRNPLILEIRKLAAQAG